MYVWRFFIHGLIHVKPSEAVKASVKAEVKAAGSTQIDAHIRAHIISNIKIRGVCLCEPVRAPFNTFQCNCSEVYTKQVVYPIKVA